MNKETLTRIKHTIILIAFITTLVLTAVTANGLHQDQALTGTMDDAASDFQMTNSDGSSEGAASSMHILAWVGLEIFVLILVVGLIRLIKRLPEPYRTWIRRIAMTVLVLLIGAYVYWRAGTQGVIIASLFIAMVFILDRFGVYWPVNNVLAIGLAVFVAVFLGYLVRPWLFVGLAILFVVFDHVFADRSTAMFQYGSALLRLRVIPVIFLVPSTFRCRLGALATTLRDNNIHDGDERVELGVSGLGMADMAFAGGFIGSIVLATGGIGLDVYVVGFGMTVGLAYLFFVSDQSGAGLPWIFGFGIPSYLLAILINILIY